MKKWIFILALLSTPALQAQEVFNTLLDKAWQVVNTKDANDYETKINYFYVTALNYMKGKMGEADEIQYKILDDQAIAMQNYVTDFFKYMGAVKDENERREIISLFIETSTGNPFFNDKDDETTKSFISDPNYITPFKLDTDWIKAYKEIREKIQKSGSPAVSNISR